jgi:uncharacterized membrane protein YhaH (DUF805 family)
VANVTVDMSVSSAIESNNATYLTAIIVVIIVVVLAAVATVAVKRRHKRKNVGPAENCKGGEKSCSVFL